MDRVRRGLFAATFLVMAMGLVLIGSGGSTERMLAARVAAAVTWPAATLLVSEIQTGGASASDEFVELTNAGPAAVDLAGLELVYVTASGGTITRKAAWSASLVLAPGRHLVIANSLGIHAALADGLYSGGLAATGGSIVLRWVGGSPIDAVGWGDAGSAYVEGTAAPAPPAGSSLERHPGGIDGNTVDTNDNLADWFIQAVPSPQTLAAPPVPAPSTGASASPDPTEQSSTAPSVAPGSPAPGGSPPPTVAPSAMPTPGPTDAPGSSPLETLQPTPSIDPSTPWPSPTASASAPAATPDGTGIPVPSPEPTAPPSAAPGVPTAAPTTAPTDQPSPDPTTVPPPGPTPAGTSAPAPSFSPVPEPMPITDVRALPDGASALIEGILTTRLGLLEAGRAAFVQDGSGGIAIYLDAVPAVPLAAGTIVRMAGTVDERYAARTLRVATDQVVPLASGPLPVALEVATGSVGEDVEGRLIRVTGWTVGSSTAYADGTGLLVDDGSGPVRVIVSPEAFDLAAAIALPAGTLVSAAGPVGQRDSSGSGLTGYRLHVTAPGEIAAYPGGPGPSGSPASPSPDPSPGPSEPASPEPSEPGSPGQSPAASPAASLAPSFGPSAAPTPPLGTPAPTAAPSPAPLPIAEARLRAIGSRVTVAGVVTAEAGRLGTPALLTIEDATGGLVIHLADGMPNPVRGTRLETNGTLAAPYGQLELRLLPDGLRVTGSAGLPVPPLVRAGAIGEAVEGRLVAIDATVLAKPWRSTSNDISFDVVDADGGRLRVMADASSGLGTTSAVPGQSYRLTGIAGQRASRKGALDGYRLWLRDGNDTQPLGAGTTQLGVGAGAETVTLIALALPREDATVVVAGVVTAPATLLDATARRIVIQDDSAAIEVLLPLGAAAPAPGSQVRVRGQVGRAYGAPRLRASSIEALAGRTGREPALVAGQPGVTLEWRLARIGGQVATVTRLGARWRAEIMTGDGRVLVDGLPGSGIPSTTLVVGRSVAVTGIIRRPYPGATDQRYSLVPRWTADVTTSAGAVVAPVGGAGVDQPDPLLEFGGVGHTLGSPGAAVLDVDIAALAEHPGELVRVGGLVVGASGDGFDLDDGTAIGSVRLDGQAAAYIGLLESGDAVNAVGLVVAGDGVGGWAVLVSSPAGLLRVGDLGEPKAIGGGYPGDHQPGGPPAELEAPPTEPGPRLGLGSLLPGGPGEVTGLVSVVLLTALSLGAGLVRRLRARRRAGTRIAARLAALAGPRSDVA